MADESGLDGLLQLHNKSPTFQLLFGLAPNFSSQEKG